MFNADAAKVKFIRQAAGISEYRLPNGLTILIKEDHCAPVVFAEMIYKAGSRHDPPGKHGLAHLLEHLMFRCPAGEFNSRKGTGYEDLSRAMGAENNALTDYDKTIYHILAPAEFLELVIAMEAARMTKLVINKQSFVSEREVVLDELRGHFDNSDVVLTEAQHTCAFGNDGYSGFQGGTKEEVERLKLADAQTFYDRYYQPNNATLCLSGDISPEEVLKLTARHFGAIPRSAKPIRKKTFAEPAQTRQRRMVKNFSVAQPRWSVGFVVPAPTHADYFPLVAIEYLLGSFSPAGRLYQALVPKGLAVDIDVTLQEMRDACLFVIYVDLSDDATVEEVEEVVFAELHKFAVKPCSIKALERIKVRERNGTQQTWANHVTLMNNLIGDAEGSGGWLAAVNFLKEFEKVTPKNIQRVAKRYLTRARSNIVLLHDAGEVEHATAGDGKEKPPAKNKPDTAVDTPQGSMLPKMLAKYAKATVRFPNLKGKVLQKTLANGLKVVLMPVPGSGTVAVQQIINAGDAYAPKGKKVLPGIMVKLLRQGSKKYTAAQMDEMLDCLWSSIDIGYDDYRVQLSGEVSTGGYPSSSQEPSLDNLKQFIELLKEVVVNPIFPWQELGRAKAEYRYEIDRAEHDNYIQARNYLLRSLYKPGSIYYPDSSAVAEQQLKECTISAVRTYHRRFFVPKNSIICLVGDFASADEIFELIEANFSRWSGDAVKPPPVRFAKSEKSGRQCVVTTMPEKENVEISLGCIVDFKRSARNYFAGLIANAIVGGDTINSRLGKMVRGVRSLTYGVESHFEGYVYGKGTWEIALSTRADQVDEAVACVLDVLKDVVTTGVSEEEVDLAIKWAVASFRKQFVMPKDIADLLMEAEWLGLGVQALENFQKQLQAVTVEEVNSFIRKHFSPRKLALSVAGNINYVKVKKRATR